MRYRGLTEFLEHLSAIPWFANIGKPVQGEGIRQINDWKQWPGPEHPPVTKYFDRHQQWYDAIIGTETPPPALQAVWDEIHTLVLRNAGATVPYDPNQDAWHGPTMAVWHAAYLAGLIGLHLQLNRPIPEDLSAEWHWFEEGHWPCGYAGLGVHQEPPGLLVF